MHGIVILALPPTKYTYRLWSWTLSTWLSHDMLQEKMHVTSFLLIVKWEPKSCTFNWSLARFHYKMVHLLVPMQLILMYLQCVHACTCTYTALLHHHHTCTCMENGWAQILNINLIRAISRLTQRSLLCTHYEQLFTMWTHCSGAMPYTYVHVHVHVHVHVYMEATLGGSWNTNCMYMLYTHADWDAQCHVVCLRHSSIMLTN